jgi:hypothetical protein
MRQPSLSILGFRAIFVAYRHFASIRRDGLSSDCEAQADPSTGGIAPHFFHQLRLCTIFRTILPVADCKARAFRFAGVSALG